MWAIAVFGAACDRLCLRQQIGGSWRVIGWGVTGVPLRESDRFDGNGDLYAAS